MTQQVSKTALDELIPLCIGGSCFTATYQTLKKSPYFQRIIENDKDSILYVSDNEIFIDRSGRLFEHVLQYLRTDDFQVEEESTLRELLVESRDYELPDMFQKVMDKLASTEKKEYLLLDGTQLADSLNVSLLGHGKKPDVVSALKFEAHYVYRCIEGHFRHTYNCPLSPSRSDSNETVLFLVTKKND